MTARSAVNRTTPNACVVCGGMFMQAQVGRGALVCSDECRAERGRQMMNALYRTRRFLARCQRVPFVARRGAGGECSSPFAWRTPPSLPAAAPLAVLGDVVPPKKYDPGALQVELADRFEVFGQKLTYREMSAKFGLPIATIYNRIRIGWSPERACTEGKRSDPKAPKRHDVGNGVRMSIGEMAAASGVKRSTIESRMRAGWTAAEAMDTEVRPQNHGAHEAVPGAKYERLTVLGDAGKNKYGATQWKVQCKCGQVKVMLAYVILQGIKSCGCLTREKASERAKARAKKFDFFGEQLTASEIGVVAGVPATTIKQRMSKGGRTAEQAAFLGVRNP